MGCHSLVNLSIVFGMMLTVLFGANYVDWDSLMSFHKKQVDTKDCYFDKECHKLVDWKVIGQAKEGLIARFKAAAQDKEKLLAVMKEGHEIFAKAGMPEERIDYIISKWAKGANAESKHVDAKDCYFDKDCHKLVDWKMIGDVKEGLIGRFRVTAHDKPKLVAVMKEGHELFKKAGMPEDRIDYIINKWVKGAIDKAGGSMPRQPWWACRVAKAKCFKDGEKVFAGKCGFFWKKCEAVEHLKKEQSNKVDTKDCFFDKECHNLVDWKKIGELKKGIMARFEHAGDNKEMIWNITHRAHALFKEAGMPEDRIDYILIKWAKYATRNAVGKEPKDCVDKGSHGVWCPKGDKWYCTKNCEKNKADADGCYDKGEHGLWCPHGDGWYCKEHCPESKPQPKTKKAVVDGQECYDKGEYGVWCPKGDGWFCKENCPDSKPKPKVVSDTDGCYDKGDYGVWCPKGDKWYCKRNCK